MAHINLSQIVQTLRTHSISYLHEHGLRELFSVHYFDGHFLARDAVHPEFHQPFQEKKERITVKQDMFSDATSSKTRFYGKEINRTRFHLLQKPDISSHVADK